MKNQRSTKGDYLIFLGSDHAGFATKEHIKNFLESKGMSYMDLGSHDKKPSDYPDFAKAVAKAVTKKKGSLGILVCGTGTGMVIAANKVKKARAALVYDKYTARKAREDNDANIIALRGRGFSKDKALELVKIFLKTKFSKKVRQRRRLLKIAKI